MNIIQKVSSWLRGFAPPQPPVPTPVETVPGDFRFSVEEKNALVREALRDEESFRVIGDLLFASVIELLDFIGLARRHLVPRLLRPDENVGALQEIEKLFVPDQELLRAAPASTITRLQRDARFILLQGEDSRFLDCLRRAAGTAWPVQKFDGPTLIGLAKMFEPDRILVHRNHIAGLITDIKCVVDPVDQRELISNGYIGTLNYGSRVASVMTNAAEAPEEIRKGEVFFLKKPEELGEFTIKQEYFAEPLKMWAGWRLIGKNRITVSKGAVLRACLA